jgi:HAD superfamily hydrolase (TIGR01458 family)
MSAILFDLDGVLYEGDTAIKGAADTVAWFTKNNIPHLFLTNTTSKPRSALVEKLARLGIETSSEQYFTPPVAAVQLLSSQKRSRLALFVPKATQAEFSDFDTFDQDMDMVDAVVIGDLATNWDFSKLNRAFRLLMHNPEAILLALGTTRYWRTADGLQLDAGPFVKALEYATGRTAVVAGKPATSFDQAAASLLAEQNSVYMIGDDIRGDTEAAQHAGFKAIQVRTGKFNAGDLELGISPDAVLDSVADLPGWWQQHVK